MIKIDDVLHSGWGMSIFGSGYAEGPQWWTARATAMGSICPRTVEIDRCDSMDELADAIRIAIADTENRTCDFNWTKDRLEAKLEKLEDDLVSFRDELDRVNQNLDLIGKPRCDKDGVHKICSTCTRESSPVEECAKGAGYCKKWERQEGLKA